MREDGAYGNPVDDVDGPAGAKGSGSGEGGQTSSPGQAVEDPGAGKGTSGSRTDEPAGEPRTRKPAERRAGRKPGGEPSGEPAAAEPSGEPAAEPVELVVGDLLRPAPPGAARDDAQPDEAGDMAEPERGCEEALAVARAEARAHLDDLLRLKAEFENYRKRVVREQTALVTNAAQSLVRRLLPVLDNFELAVSSAEQSRDFDRMLKGVEMVYGELREVLRTEGLEPIEADGRKFDPALHEAVLAVDAQGVDEGTVVDVVRPGYAFGGKVLRPAMVKVAR